MAPRFLTILTGRNMPKIRQPGPEPSIINEKTLADFARVVEQTRILEREPLAAWNFFRAGGLYLPALGYSNAGGRPRWAHPPVTRRVSELERPQCNCPALGPFSLWRCALKQPQRASGADRRDGRRRDINWRGSPR
jgi:hypothetical protein